MIVLIGESGAGKTTVERALVDKGFTKVVSHTSRPKRAGEIDGLDYHFVSLDMFKSLVGAGFFAEYALFAGNYYGSALKAYNSLSVITVEREGLFQLQENPNVEITSFYIHVDAAERILRMTKDKRPKQHILDRIAHDEEHFQGIENEVDYILDNLELHQVIKMIIQVVGG